MLRKFQLVGGFPDVEDHIEVDIESGKSFIVYKDESRKEARFYPLSKCLDFVISGSWVELKQESEEPKMCEGGCNCKEPIDFSTAQVGDIVRCLLNGDVEVKEPFYCHDEWPVEVRYVKDGEEEEQYCTDGRLDGDHLKPSLQGWIHPVTGNLCRTRPEPEIDWSKVAIDTPVEVTNGEGEKEVLHFAEHNGKVPVFWDSGRTSHTGNYKIVPLLSTYKIIDTKSKGE